jgi:hypothetical protein
MEVVVKLIRVLIAVSLFVPFVVAANPVPFLSQPLVPASVAPGSASLILTVNGAGFVSGSVVNWNGKPQPTTFVSQGQLKAQIASSLISQVGTGSITVSSGGVASNTAFLPILAPVPTVHWAPSTGAARGLSIGSLVEADFNGDGKTDLAYTTGDNYVFSTSWTVGVALSNGDGTFVGAGKHKTLRFPSVVADDINGDGRIDLVALDFTTNIFGPLTISVFMGNGDGTFQQRKDYPTTVFSVSDGLLADFNGDGKLDLVFGNGDQMAVMLGNGDGTFQPAILSSDAVSPWEMQIAVGDINHDGKLDVAFISVYQPPVWVALGNGDGTFQPATVVLNTGFADQLVLADFNGDGNLDLMTAGDMGDLFFAGNGDGTFASGISVQDNMMFASGMGTADLNGDGVLDLIVAHQRDSVVSYLLGNGDGTFQPYKTLLRATPVGLVLADFNGDGRIDFGMVTNDGSDNGNSTVSTTVQTP